MLAQRQPSFKDRVIAHWPSGPAPKMIGTEAGSRSRGGAILDRDLVGERRMLVEGSPRGALDGMRVIMQA
jgi:hypothetical protein